MRLSLNWIQRVILLLGGAVLTLSAMNAMEGYGSDEWLATVLFVLALSAFVLAASSGRRADG